MHKVYTTCRLAEHLAHWLVATGVQASLTANGLMLWAACLKHHCVDEGPEVIERVEKHSMVCLA